MALTIEQMSSRSIDEAVDEHALEIPSLLVSADAHVDEPVELWDELPEEARDRLPKLGRPKDERPQGGLNPSIRLEHMDLDGVAADVIYPTAVLRAFTLPRDIQEPAFRLYNDWLADYCKTAPNRLFGVPCLCVYDIDWAVREMQRCADMGLVGGLIWQVPDPELPLHSGHYDRLWAAAAELGKPINFHILSGFTYFRDRAKLAGAEVVRGAVNTRMHEVMTTVFDLIWYGTFDRHPQLKVELVECEIGWMPFVLQQMDYYFHRFSNVGQSQVQEFAITRPPSEIFNDHFYGTFMDDTVGAHMLKVWGQRNCMWSSDYPHGNMTWPHSRAFVAKQIGGLDAETQRRLTSQNVIDLYGLTL
ncbi:MAG: amidohydrolase family protein [Alphaproteobacteria bacterium]|nr:amidohydrolase family protein [Alphaproteobacteria bacterium]